MPFDPNTAQPESSASGAKFDPSTAAPESRSFGDNILRQLGLATRYGVEGAAYIPAAIADIPAYAYNKGADLIQGEGNGYRFPEQNQAVSNALTKAGLPEPETGLEKVVGDASRAVAGAGLATGAGKLLGKAVSPVAQRIGAILESSPGYQATGAAVSGAGASGAHELGTGTAGEVAGATAGLLVPTPGGKQRAAQILGRAFGREIGDDEAAQIATNYLVKTLGRDELTPGQIAQNIADAGPKPMTIADAGGENTVSALRTATQSPGIARNQAKQFLQGRQDAQRERIIGDTDATFGSDNAEKLSYATKANRSANAENDFKQAFQTGVVRTKPLSALFQAPAMKDAIGYAQEIAGNEYAVARANGNLGAADTEDWAKAVSDIPNKTAFPARYLHFLKMGLDAKLESLRDPITGVINYSNPAVKAADSVRKQFRSEIKKLNPYYAEALDNFSSDSALLTAQRDGAAALKLRPDQIATMRNRMSPQEQSRFRVGFGKAISDMIEASGDGTNAARRIAGNTLMRKRVAAVLGSQKEADNFLRSVGVEDRMYQTRAAMGGSMTAPRLLDEADLAGHQVGDMALRVARHGSPRTALLDMAAQYMGNKYDQVANGLTEQVKNHLAGMLISSDPQERQAAIEHLMRVSNEQPSLIPTRPVGQLGAYGITAQQQ